MFEFIADFPGETACNDNDPASGKPERLQFSVVWTWCSQQIPDEKDSLVLLKLPLLFIL